MVWKHVLISPRQVHWVNEKCLSDAVGCHMFLTNSQSQSRDVSGLCDLFTESAVGC